MSDKQWGPWIDHDGKGCPCVGELVQCETGSTVKLLNVDALVLGDRLIQYIPLAGSKHRSWYWVPGFNFILKYRIRKPKGLTMLENILAEVETKQPKVYVDVEV